MTDWKQGDIVTFTMTGRINYKHGEGYSVTADQPVTEGYWHPETTSVVIKESQILGTPEQAKRERIMAILRQEFGFHFRLEPMPNDDKGFFVVIEDVLSEDLREQWIQTIRERVTELEAQQEI